MGNIFDRDFRDFLSALNDAEVEYLLVGGYAVIFHGYPRTTGDMDIWVKRTKANYEKIIVAFSNFGMPVFDMTEENFLYHEIWDVFSFGRPPVGIDIMVQVKGLTFETAFNNSVFFEDDGLQIRTINYHDLINAKKASARPKDEDDISNLS